jgi:uncharacterized DUF497 family protein
MIKVFLIPVEEEVARLDTSKADVVKAYESGKGNICVMDLEEFEYGFNLERLPRNLEEHNVRFIECDTPDKDRIINLIKSTLSFFGSFEMSDMEDREAAYAVVFSGAGVVVQVESLHEDSVRLVSIPEDAFEVELGSEEIPYDLLDTPALKRIYDLVMLWAAQNSVEDEEVLSSRN